MKKQSKNGYTAMPLIPESAGHVQDLISVKMDKVHPIPNNADDFIRMRVGGLNDNKQCWVLLDAADDIKAVLYTFQDTSYISSETDLNGNMSGILSTPVTALTEPVKSIIFYSVASFDNGAGFRLIDTVCSRFSGAARPALSTLSPLRGLGHWAQSSGRNLHGIRCEKKKLKKLALAFLKANEDKVQQFHMRNGAYIGDIKLEANARGSMDDMRGMNVMVNYVYPKSKKREANKEAYSNGYLTLADHLVGGSRETWKPFKPVRLKIS